MGILKNYATGIFLLIAEVFFAQGSSNYQTSYPTFSANTASSTITATAKEKIDANIAYMISDPVLKSARWSFALYDPKSKKLISSYNESTPLVPASTTKLLTTETALNLLGENYRWLTQLEYSGTVDETGTLNGNLYVVGSGDPSLGSGKAGASSYGTIIANFISALHEKGINKVSGDIVMQNAVFKENRMESLPENIVWMEHSNYYLPVGNTANMDPRKEKLVIKQSSPQNESKKYFYISTYTGKIVFAEDFTSNSLMTKLPDVPAYLSNNLRTSMIKSGISVTGKVISKIVDPQPEARKILEVYKSPTLREIVEYTNKKSDNALAESTLRMVGFQKKGDQTLETGRSVVLKHLEESGFDTKGLSYMDGSGLSKNNTVTAISQVKYLSSLMDKKYFKSFYESLPIGGQDGTLKKMFFGNGYGRVFAKTGTLNKVKTLAGFVKTNSGKTLVFSLLINNYTGSVDQVKSRMESILDPVLLY